MINSILLFAALIGWNLAQPTLQSATKYVKTDLKMMDDIYSVGMWDLTFDDDLYGYQGFGSVSCFNNTSCRSSNLPCDPCDWTDPLICSGQIRGPNTTCPCGTPPQMCFPGMSQFILGNWPKNATSTIVEVTDGITDVAFHPKPPNNCSCIIFRVDVIEGGIEGILLWYGETLIGNSGLNVLSRHGTATVCPSDPRWGQSHVVRVVGGGPKIPYGKVRLSIQYREVTKKVYSSACTVPTSLTSTHRCLPTGVMTVLSPTLGSLRVSINPTQRCGVLGFWASSNEHLLSTNPWVSPQNATNALRTHRKGPADNRPWPSLYPYCLQPNEQLYAFILSSTPVTFLIDVEKDWMVLRSFSEFQPGDFFQRFLGAVTVQCPSKNFTAHRGIYTISETMDTGSANVRMVYPSDDLDTFYPPPFFASDPYLLLQNIPMQPLTPGRLVVSVFLNQRLVARSQPLVWTQPWFQNAYEWLTIEEWNQCTLKIGGMIADVNGTGLNVIVTENDLTSGSDRAGGCDPDAYALASAAIDEIHAETSDLVSQSDVSLAEVYRLWFLQDRIAASNVFDRCKREIESHYEITEIATKSVMTDQCVAAFNTSDFNSDPCCLLNATSLYDNCVANTRVVKSQFVVDRYNSKFNNCSTRECAQLSFVNLRLQLNIDSDPTACLNSVDRPVDQNIYYQCVDKIWGQEPVTFAGPNCTHDVDCPGSKCSIHSKRCFVDIVASEAALISCIYDGLTQFTRVFVSNELGIDPTSSNIKSLWLEAFKDTLFCSDPYTPIGFNMNVVVFGACYACDGYAINSSAFISNWAFSPGPSWASHGYSCWAPGSTSCSLTTLTFSARSFCSIRGCNRMPFEKTGYFPFSVTPNYCDNSTFCGVTDDGFFYQDVTPIIPLGVCNNATLCILANGSRIQTNTSSECTSTFSCDVDCNGSPCFTEVDCLNAGSCSDATDYDVGIWTRLYKDETAGCFFTIRYREPFNPTVSICQPPFRNTIIGCSVYPGPAGLSPTGLLFPINQSACVSGQFAWGDPKIFQLINPRWITPAMTQAQCLNYGMVCDHANHPEPAGIPTHANTLSFNDQCFTTRDLFHWKPGRWLPGQSRTAIPVVGNVTTRFQGPQRNGLNLPRILANLTKAVNKLTSLKVQSSSFCRSAYKQYLDELVCSCVTGYNESFCYRKRGNITNIGVACDEESEISAGDLKIFISNISLPPARCDNLFISRSSIIIYQSREITPLRTLLVNYQEDTEYAIRNHKLGIYGKVLTDGYVATFDTEITSVVLCIKLSALRQRYQDQLSTYSVLDLARRPSDSLPDDLVPLNLSITFNNVTNVFCASLNRLEKNQIYYFIQRVNGNYSNVDRSVFSYGDKVYISILLALYCLGFVAVCFRFGHLLFYCYETESTYAYNRLAWILFLLGSFFIFRIVLFSLLLSQSLLGSVSTRAINYVLFEFPILLFFTFVTNYICIWLTVIAYGKNLNVDYRKMLVRANYVSVFLNLVIGGLFIIIIILFETIIAAATFICGGAALQYDSDQAFALLLSYRVIFSTIAMILGIGLIGTAIMVSWKFGSAEYGFKKKSIFKMCLVAGVASLGLIGQAILFLIITATQKTPENVASLSILLVLEIIPALLFVFVDPISKPKNKSSGSRSTKKSGDRSSGKSGDSIKSDDKSSKQID
ncbi:Hypothetical protein POVR1_LOCUS312 [uncultured virus]|nr:Hypothetical protein POVR1_LOCUS312 [uncultured virus]